VDDGRLLSDEQQAMSFAPPLRGHSATTTTSSAAAAPPVPRQRPRNLEIALDLTDDIQTAHLKAEPIERRLLN
jgi:hypothetical protein